MFKNNVISNPRGWGQKAVGTRAGYIVLQFASLFNALSLSFMFNLLVKKELQIEFHIFIHTLIWFSTFLFPIFYLRSLRAYVTVATTKT